MGRESKTDKTKRAEVRRRKEKIVLKGERSGQGEKRGNRSEEEEDK